MRQDLFSRLAELKTLRKVYKSLGNRALELNDSNRVILEHAQDIDSQQLDSIVSFIRARYDIGGEIIFSPRSQITGGVRLFLGDSLLDISFESMRQKFSPIS